MWRNRYFKTGWAQTPVWWFLKHSRMVIICLNGIPILPTKMGLIYCVYLGLRFFFRKCVSCLLSGQVLWHCCLIIKHSFIKNSRCRFFPKGCFKKKVEMKCIPEVAYQQWVSVFNFIQSTTWSYSSNYVRQKFNLDMET